MPFKIGAIFDKNKTPKYLFWIGIEIGLVEMRKLNKLVRYKRVKNKML